MYDVSVSAYVNDGTNTDTTIGKGDLLCSVSGVKPISGLKKPLTKTNAETMALNRGSGWHLETIKATMANTLLMMIEFGTLNSQTALGDGVVSIAGDTSFNDSSLTGSTAALGNASGAASETVNEIGGTETTYNVNGKVSVSYRGVENPWGNIWKHIQGINIWGNGTMAGGQPYIADGLSDFSETTHTGNYKAVGFTLPNASGYINAFGYGKQNMIGFYCLRKSVVHLHYLLVIAPTLHPTLTVTGLPDLAVIGLMALIRVLLVGILLTVSGLIIGLSAVACCMYQPQ